MTLKARCSARQGHTTLNCLRPIYLGETQGSLYIAPLSLDITHIDDKIFEKLKILNTTLNYNSLPLKNFDAKLETGISVDEIQDKYDTFINEIDEKQSKEYVIYGIIGFNIFTFIVLGLITDMCLGKIGCPSFKKNRENKFPMSRSASYTFNALRPIDMIYHPSTINIKPTAPGPSDDEEEKEDNNTT